MQSSNLDMNSNFIGVNLMIQDIFDSTYRLAAISTRDTNHWWWMSDELRNWFLYYQKLLKSSVRHFWFFSRPRYLNFFSLTWELSIRLTAQKILQLYFSISLHRLNFISMVFYSWFTNKSSMLWQPCTECQ